MKRKHAVQPCFLTDSTDSIWTKLDLTLTYQTIFRKAYSQAE